MNARITQLESRLDSTPEESSERVNLLNDLFWQIWALDPRRAEELVSKQMALARKLQYEAGIAYAKCNQGMILFSQARVEQALNNLLEAARWFEENQDTEGQATALHGLALLYWGFGDFERGFDAIQNALNLFGQIDHCDGKGWTLNSLGAFYYDWKDYAHSKETFRKALGIFKQTRNRTGEARALNGLGNAYHLIGDHKKALAYHKRSLKIQQSVGNIVGESRTLNDIGLLLQSHGEFEAALEYHQKSLSIRQQIGYPQGETTNLLDIGDIYLKQKKYDQALRVFQRAQELSERIRAKVKMARAHKALYEIYKTLGQYNKALEHHEKFQTIDEEVYHEDVDKKLKNLKAVYQVESSKKEAEIYRLKNVELKAKNEELQGTLKKLNATQAQLVQAGKMAALGQLVAGITHEINTPMGAIKSAADVIDRVYARAKQVLDAGEAATDSDKIKRLKSVFNILKKNTEITSGGIKRIQKIMQSLKNFSQLDGADFQKFNIHDGLDSALTLIEHEIREGIKICREYGDIPAIYCHPGELNQVFMNLLLNAIQSIDGKGTVSITTYFKKGQVHVRIADTGKGIASEKLDQLFEPGFTEKHARVRMRMGLYTSYNIILKHAGNIKVESQIGEGTCFTVSLPGDLNKLAARANAH